MSRRQVTMAGRLRSWEGSLSWFLRFHLLRRFPTPIRLISSRQERRLHDFPAIALRDQPRIQYCAAKQSPLRRPGGLAGQHHVFDALHLPVEAYSTMGVFVGGERALRTA